MSLHPWIPPGGGGVGGEKRSLHISVQTHRNAVNRVTVIETNCSRSRLSAFHKSTI